MSDVAEVKEALERWPTATHEEIDADGGIGDEIFAAARRWVEVVECLAYGVGSTSRRNARSVEE